MTLSAAVIKGQDGTGQAIYPGAREELVERAIRKLAVQQVVNTGLHTVPQSGAQIIRVSFTLYQLRKELTSQGHGFKLMEQGSARSLEQGDRQFGVLQGSDLTRHQLGRFQQLYLRLR